MIGILMIQFFIVKKMILQKDTGNTVKNVVRMAQVHGSRVVRVDIKDAGHIIESCDGLLTNDPLVTLKISVADCIPLALFDPVGKSIGLIHAGWRGLDSEIINIAVGEMERNFGTKPEDLLAEIGPHICRDHYEIKDDLLSNFSAYPRSLKRKNGKIYLDIGTVALTQLLASGLKKENIVIDKRCTYENLSLPSCRRGDMKKRGIFFLKVPSQSTAT